MGGVLGFLLALMFVRRDRRKKTQEAAHISLAQLLPPGGVSK